MRNSRIRLLIDIENGLEREDIPYKSGDEFDVLIEDYICKDNLTVKTAIDTRDYGLAFFNNSLQTEYEEIPIVNADINTSLSESTNTKN